MYKKGVKRAFDIIISLIIIVLLFPLFFLVCLLSLLVHGKPLFYTQKRPGLNGDVFKIIKLRTMRNIQSASGELLPDAKRLTYLGSILRSTSIDELPGLFNVLIGDMSLVGPRPLLVEYLSLYSKEQARRHNVRPGITGWAQVNGRNAISWDQKFKLDVWYVDNQSFFLDLKILLLTVKKVFVREGISADGHVTIEPFKGSDND